MTIKIYYVRNKRRKREKEFFEFLKEVLGSIVTSGNEKYTLQEQLSDKTLKIDTIIERIKKSKFISDSKKRDVLRN